ncbi:hypothetical protein BCR36DRAFT_582589 [Piromyces finnis]|uniref:Coth-domain-containing protein n=1 Tax=Piromyces finnis TaxID=1754191 RepID=A0A1Y1VBN9_9FUNG|nr:hypothetical protein BCR36DRAFT_582589 [Piromyces finnis]|eukprot:ORX52071.1 hypothetical protein BCR36DRAFT_582589 [Piromyces finnis]
MRVLSTSLLLTTLVSVYSKSIENHTIVFNLESGFYNNDSIELQIKSSDSNASIYYTLDGSIPSENSTLYENPIILKNKSEDENVLSAILNIEPTKKKFKPTKKITKGNVIRAIAKFSDASYSEVISGTYFVGLDRQKLYGDFPVISIITDPDNLFDYEKGIYVLGKTYDDYIASNVQSYYPKGNFSNKGRESERPATIEYLPFNDNQKGFKQNVGIRIMGNASRLSVQKSFRVLCREEYGKKSLKYELIPNNMRSDGTGPVTKYKSFNIRNGGNDNEFMKYRDIALQTLISNRDFETQQSDIAIAFIDGEYWGVYQLSEDYSDNYIANNYDINSDNVVIIKKNKVEAGEEDDKKLFDETMNYIYSNDLSVDVNYSNLLKSFDIDNFAWYTAFIIYIGSVDCILQDNNWAMWRVRTPDQNTLNADGKWRMLTYDTEFSSGLYSDGTKFDDTILYDIFNKANSNPRFGVKLLKAFIENKEFKNLFINALSDVRNIDFEASRVNDYIDNMYNRTAPLMLDNYNRFGPDYVLYFPEKYYTSQVEYFKTYLTGRYNVFMKHIEKTFKFKPAVTVSVISNDYRKGSFKVNHGWKLHNKKYEGEYFRENILYLTAVPVEGETFRYWKMKNCKLADSSYGPVDGIQSNKTTIGIYPSYGCRLTAFYK